MDFYPLQFKPIYKQKIWGGQKIRSTLGKDFGKLLNCGESWELSGVEGNVSVIANGSFAGRPLDSLVNQYPEEILGKKYRTEKFPLLIKFLDANDDLSIQVHPDDELALKKHGGRGKTEMWYIIDAEPEAKMFVGFSKPITKEEFLSKATTNAILELVSTESVHPGDVFYIPAGRIHSIGKGILLAEIQQTSDITYRIYDFERKGDDGQPRELHIRDAAYALNFNDAGHTFKTSYAKNEPYTKLVQSPYFITNKIQGENTIQVQKPNSFRIYIVINGAGIIVWGNNKLTIKKADVVLMPACISEYIVETKAGFSGLEVFLP